MKVDLLEKIERLFWKNSFAELSMDDVAKELSMKKASLYYHFASKEEMFIKTLEFSYGRYLEFLESIFKLDDISSMIRELIEFPCKQMNLFAIVSQKGYCGNVRLGAEASTRNCDIDKVFYSNLSSKFGFSEEKSSIFKAVIDDFSKKRCIFECDSEKKSENIIKEIKKLFF